MTQTYVWRDSCTRVTCFMHVCGTWLIRMCGTDASTARTLCGVTHACVSHDLFICVTWLSHICDVTHAYVSRDPCICVKELIHMWGMTHSYVWHRRPHPPYSVWHDSFICVTWLIHMRDMTCSYVRHDSSIRVAPTLLSLASRVCDIAHPYVCVIWLSCARHDSLLTLIWLSYARHAVCCSVLQCVAVCCSVLQCVAVCCSVWQCVSHDSHMRDTQCAAMCHSVLQCVAVLGNVFHMTLMCEARFQKEQLHMRDTTYLPKKNQDY